MGASLSATAGQDSATFQIRGLNDDAAADAGAVLADVVRNPTFPQGELDLMKATTAQRLQAQAASPQFVNNKLFRQTLFGDHPYSRTGVTQESLPAIDRDAITDVSPDLLPSEQRVPGGGRRRGARSGVRGRGEGASAAGSGARCPRRKPLRLPALKGRTLVFVQRPNSVQSSISVGNFTPAPQRRALVHAAARQPDLRCGVRLAARPEHPRREGLHLFAAVAVPGDGAGRPVSSGGRRAQRSHRRDAQGDLRRDRQAARRRTGGRGAERRQAVFARPVRDPERHADRPGEHAQYGQHVRAAEGLSGDIPAPDLAAVSRSGEDRRARCCSAPRIRWS